MRLSQYLNFENYELLRLPRLQQLCAGGKPLKDQEKSSSREFFYYNHVFRF